MKFGILILGGSSAPPHTHLSDPFCTNKKMSLPLLALDSFPSLCLPHRHSYSCPSECLICYGGGQSTASPSWSCAGHSKQVGLRKWMFKLSCCITGNSVSLFQIYILCGFVLNVWIAIDICVCVLMLPSLQQRCLLQSFNELLFLKGDNSM